VEGAEAEDDHFKQPLGARICKGAGSFARVRDFPVEDVVVRIATRRTPMPILSACDPRIDQWHYATVDGPKGSDGRNRQSCGRRAWTTRGLA
jgi:hypothetical protein